MRSSYSPVRVSARALVVRSDELRIRMLQPPGGGEPEIVIFVNLQSASYSFDEGFATQGEISVTVRI